VLLDTFILQVLCWIDWGNKKAFCNALLCEQY